MDLKHQIREIVESHIEDKERLCQLGDDYPVDILQINSLIFMKIIIDIEDKFEMEFDFDKLDINNFKTIDKLYEYVKRKLEPSDNDTH